MGLFDEDTGFGSKKVDKPIEIKSVGKDFQGCDFDRSLVEKINPLVKVDVINQRYNLGKLLTDLGLDVSGSNMYCPFHPDEMTGKPSAKYHADTDLLYCFSENKMYSAYHAIKLLYGIDIDKVFMDIWSKISLEERHAIMDKYDSEDVNVSSMPSEWEKYKSLVLDKFRTREVSFKQYKNALYKVLRIVCTDVGGAEE